MYGYDGGIILWYFGSRTMLGGSEWLWNQNLLRYMYETEKTCFINYEKDKTFNKLSENTEYSADKVLH